MNERVLVTDQAFDPAAEAARVSAGNPRVGGVVSFVGLMRDLNEGDKVHAMRLEHYPGMTEKALEGIVEEALRRWQVEGVRVVHRVGELRPQDPIVLVAVGSRHRGEAFRACEFIIDYLKTQAPFWKKELTGDGERWVAARDADEATRTRWETG